MSVLRVLLRKTFASLVGDSFKVHRIPFGPIAGSYIYMKPSISPRMYLGVDEKDLARTATRLIRKNDCVYDVGAHIGYTSILFGKLVGTGGSVQAFELMPSTAEVLRKSLLLNNLKQCRVHVVGLGISGGKITLARGLTYMGSLYGSTQSPVGTNDEECAVVRLDDYCVVDQLPPPHFIKMDIECAEIDALHGARQTLLDTTPMLFVEFHSLSLLKDGLDLLGELGYTLQLLTGSVLTREYVGGLTFFHQTVLCYKPSCDWHTERIVQLTGSEVSPVFVPPSTVSAGRR